jgi:hypothetical protein
MEPGPAAAGDDWETTDTLLFGAFAAAQAVDCIQTRWILDHEDEGYYEKNPFLERLGKNGVPVAFAAYTAGGYLLMRHTPKGVRRTVIGLLTILSVNCINNNFSIGVGFAF